MAEIVMVDDRKTGVTNASWKADAERLDNVRFVISEKTGTVYMHDGVTTTSEGRVNFKHLYRASPEIQEKYKDFREDKGRSQGEANPVRYFDT
ncbi:MAG: hypothetical protein IKP60_10415 [Treponema sp.]|nr:hypothetical protein [Treponema sp.]